MAADMSDRGLVVACDVRARRMSLLRETVRVERRGVRPHRAGAGDRARCRSRRSSIACSWTRPAPGLGTIRRDPDIRWRRQRGATCRRSPRDQLALLERAAPVVAPGGRLVYATCSSEPEENEAVVDAFLSRHPDFALVDLRADGAPLPAAAARRPRHAAHPAVRTRARGVLCAQRSLRR